MELEFDIEDLLQKRKIEEDRIEFKKGWNPGDIYRSICAFANDYDNVGGGYILVGVEEHDGIAVRPVCGVPDELIDMIQKEALGYNHKIHPEYYARIIRAEVDEKNVMVFWVPTSVQRPHKTLENVANKKDNHYKTFIRYGSSSIVASQEQERELIVASSREPFDMLGNEQATFEDISPILLTEHLKATGSRLASQVNTLGVQNILEQMQLLSGPPERLRIRNVALMMFCEEPDRFFPYMQTDIVRFPKGSVNDPNNFREYPPIKGPVPMIIKRSMELIKDVAISEFVHKVDGQMEAERVWSYPYESIEEALVNAYYHRDYMSYQPVSVEIEPDCIRIYNCPGIDRSIPMDVIRKGERFRTRFYRNRRLGEFLKELDMTEGQSTGIPTIQQHLEQIGSPPAVFETDMERKQVCVIISINPRYLELEGLSSGIKEDREGSDKSSYIGSDKSSDKKSNMELNPTQTEILKLIKDDPKISALKIAETLSMSSRGIEKNISKLKELGILIRYGERRGGYWEIKTQYS